MACPILPDVDSTNGVNVACSTSCTRWSYYRLFSCSCLWNTDEREPWQFDWVLGLNLTSTNAFSNLPPQNPYIAISSQAPSSVMAKQWDKDSSESGCRWGLVVTSWHTSVSSVAVLSLPSLCLTAGKPPVLQVKVCSILNGCPQLQWDGKLWSGHPYLRERLALKAALCKAKLCSSMGSAVSQVEAPFFWESSKEYWRVGGRLLLWQLPSALCV